MDWSNRKWNAAKCAKEVKESFESRFSRSEIGSKMKNEIPRAIQSLWKIQSETKENRPRSTKDIENKSKAKEDLKKENELQRLITEEVESEAKKTGEKPTKKIIEKMTSVMLSGVIIGLVCYFLLFSCGGRRTLK